ncbi:MAG: trehalose import ATP-binding protein SugC [Myxococcales bacterium]
MARVLLQHVQKRYAGDVLAVRDLSLEIRDKEFMVLVGPSGCGKSTTLRMIAGLEDISEGDLFIGERRVNDVAPKDRDIAMVFQSYALYPHMTVYDNMAFGLKLKGVPKDTIRSLVDDAAHILGITEYLQRKPKALSGGQRQRVAMGRAIVRQPQVFLFDEPLSNLDAKLRVAMRVELAQLHQRLQTTVVYVTHDQIEAMTLATRIAIMDGGVLQQVGTPMEVYHTPRNRFVAGFIGSPGMNFLDAELTAGGTVAQGNGFRVRLGAHLAAAASAARGTVTLGIRPQHLRPAEPGAEAAIEARADVVEHMGAEKYIYFALGGHTLVARADGEDPVAAGEAVRFAVDSDRLHLFAADGRNLAVP